jgi:WD40 repeat protein
MGRVYAADQLQPVQRRVALKVLKADFASPGVPARFEQERQALALMDHPNIAKVFDGGADEFGRPFLVMELVKGIPITKYCDQEKLTPRERLELFIPICQAVQHAHQKGIIHRDLKPSNILVALYDDRPVPKVIDFGLAKVTGQRLAAHPIYTEAGNIVGTLEYMAPEQAELTNLDIDTRADIYALGALLYELLTGSPPFSREQLRSATLDEMLRLIREVEPPRPSSKLSSADELPSIAAKRKLEPKRLTRSVHGDLDWIVMKCLAKERRRRYETATGLAMDLQRYLADEPVVAGPPSTGYRLRKFARKYRKGLATATAFLLLLVLGVVVSAWMTARATLAEGAAEERRDAAEKAERQAQDERDAAENERRRAEQNEEKAKHSLYVANMHRIQLELENNSVSAARALLDLYRPGAGAEGRPGWEWYYWDRVCHAELHTLKGHKDRVINVAYSPDGALLASAGGDADGVVKIWDAVTGEELRALHGDEYVFSQVAFSPDGKLLATCGVINGTAKLWEVATWTELPGWKQELADKFQCVAFSPNGKTLALSETQSKRVKFLDLDAKAWSGQLPAGTNSFRIQYSPDGKLIGLVHPDGVQLWDVNRKKLLRTLRGHSFLNYALGGYVSEAITGLAFNPDGQLLATCSQDGTVKMRKVSNGTEVRSITVMSARRESFSGLTGLAFSPDGKYLVTSGYSTPLTLWEVSSGRKVRSFFGPVSAEAVSFSPDGTRLASAAFRGGEVTVWDAAGEPAQHLFLDEMYHHFHPQFSPDGTLLAESLSHGALVGEVQLRDADTGRLVARLDHKQASVSTFTFRSDNLGMATAVRRNSRDTGKVLQEIHLWDLRSRQEVGAITGLDLWITNLAFSPDDRFLASVVERFDSKTQKRTGEVKVWDVKTREEQRTFPGTSMAFSPNGTTLAVVGIDESVRLFDLGTGQARHTFPSRSGRYAIAFSRDGKRLCDGQAVWDVTDRREVCTLEGNNGAAEFSPDGRRLFSLRATSRTSGLLRVWDAATGNLLASIPVQGSEGWSLHPDGWRCAVTSAYTGTWIVDARPLTPELRRKREAHNLVAHLIYKPMFKDELLDQLKRAKTVSEPLRREALALAATTKVPSWVFVFSAWFIVLYPDGSENQYRQALRWLEEANRLTPNEWGTLNELGMAQYRLGRFKEAAATLETAFKIGSTQAGGIPAGDLVFLAMAQHRLGREEEARKTLARARDPRMDPGSVSPHVWREAETLIEGKTSEPEK